MNIIIFSSWNTLARQLIGVMYVVYRILNGMLYPGNVNGTNSPYHRFVSVKFRTKNVPKNI